MAGEVGKKRKKLSDSEGDNSEPEPVEKKRGRGRPRKDSTAAPKASTTTTTVKRGRGRPSKSTAEKKTATKKSKEDEEPPRKRVKRDHKEEEEEPAPKTTKKEKKDKKQNEEEEEEHIVWKEWKNIYLVGTEWENYDTVFETKWDFDHLYEDLTSGYLSKSPNKIFIFGATEGQLAPDPKDPSKQRVILFPVLNVIDAKLAPPSELAITSVQRGEEMKHMRDLKIEWTPYLPTRETWKQDIMRLKKKASKMYILVCTARRPQIDQLPIEAKKEYEYAVPYIWIPRLNEDVDYDTSVQIVTECGGRGLTFEYDWEMDEIPDMLDELFPESGDKEKYGKQIEELIKEKVTEAKTKIREQKQALKEKKERMSPELIESLNTLKCYKYYPQNEDYPIERSPFINRYYGKAIQVFPEPQAAFDYSTLKPITDINPADMQMDFSDAPEVQPTAPAKQTGEIELNSAPAAVEAKSSESETKKDDSDEELQDDSEEEKPKAKKAPKSKKSAPKSKKSAKSASKPESKSKQKS